MYILYTSNTGIGIVYMHPPTVR